MYHVFKNRNGELQAVDTGNPNSKEEVESILKENGWQPGQNWYGSSAGTLQGAIDEALTNKCNFDADISSLEELAKYLSSRLK